MGIISNTATTKSGRIPQHGFRFPFPTMFGSFRSNEMICLDPTILVLKRVILIKDLN